LTVSRGKLNVSTLSILDRNCDPVDTFYMHWARNQGSTIYI